MGLYVIIAISMESHSLHLQFIVRTAVVYKLCRYREEDKTIDQKSETTLFPNEALLVFRCKYELRNKYGFHASNVSFITK